MSSQSEVYALLIGINEYKDSVLRPLRYAVADVLAFREFLVNRMRLKDENTRVLVSDRAYGEPATLMGIMNALKSFVRKEMGPDDLFVMYYAAHGFGHGDESFLCATDTMGLDPDDELSSTKFTLSLKELASYQKRISAGKQLIILDACRNDPIGGHKRGYGSAVIESNMSRDIATMVEVNPASGGVDQPRVFSRAVLRACWDRQASYEYDDGRHSWFCHNLLGCLETCTGGRVDISALTTDVAERMKRDAWRLITAATGQTPHLDAGGLPLVLDVVPIEDPGKKAERFAAAARERIGAADYAGARRIAEELKSLGIAGGAAAKAVYERLTRIADEQCRQARDRLARDDVPGAWKFLEEAESAFPGHAAMRSIREEIAQAEAVSDVAARIRANLGSGDYAYVRANLTHLSALGALGMAKAREIQGQIDALTKNFLAQVEKEIWEGRAEEAVAAAEKALAVWPEDERVLAALDRARCFKKSESLRHDLLSRLEEKRYSEAAGVADEMRALGWYGSAALESVEKELSEAVDQATRRAKELTHEAKWRDALRQVESGLLLRPEDTDLAGMKEYIEDTIDQQEYVREDFKKTMRLVYWVVAVIVVCCVIIGFMVGRKRPDGTGVRTVTPTHTTEDTSVTPPPAPETPPVLAAWQALQEANAKLKAAKEFCAAGTEVDVTAAAYRIAGNWKIDVFGAVTLAVRQAREGRGTRDGGDRQVAEGRVSGSYAGGGNVEGTIEGIVDGSGVFTGGWANSNDGRRGNIRLVFSGDTVTGQYTQRLYTGTYVDWRGQRDIAGTRVAGVPGGARREAEFSEEGALKEFRAAVLREFDAAFQAYSDVAKRFPDTHEEVEASKGMGDAYYETARALADKSFLDKAIDYHTVYLKKSYVDPDRRETACIGLAKDLIERDIPAQPAADGKRAVRSDQETALEHLQGAYKVVDGVKIYGPTAQRMIRDVKARIAAAAKAEEEKAKAEAAEAKKTPEEKAAEERAKAVAELDAGAKSPAESPASSGPDMSGEWKVDQFGVITLTRGSNGRYTGSYTVGGVIEDGTVANGKFTLQWKNERQNTEGKLEGTVQANHLRGVITSGTGQWPVTGERAGQWSPPEGVRPVPESGPEPYTNTGLPREVIHENTGIVMVFAPAGEFTMGSRDGEDGREADEGPQHKVRITKPFYLGKYEVTQGEWQKVMGSNPSHFKGDRNPVEQVSWNDCQAFISKAKAGLRLPTEAEWEYACRAGSTDRFCFGGDDQSLAGYAWYRDNSGRRTHEAGQFGPNKWGLCDMQGNVWEWCRDWYDGMYYNRSAEDDPEGPSSGKERVLRGGSWDHQPENCRSANRGYDDPSAAFTNLGLRVARTID